MNLIQLQHKLGERMEALCNNDLTGDELVREIERSKAVAAVAGQMVRNSNIIINAKKMVGTLDAAFVDSVVSGV